jgi:hypothetical protein
VKVNFWHTRLAVIGGRATDSGSLAIGVFHDGRLRYVGQVGMAMARRQAEQLDAAGGGSRSPRALASGAVFPRVFAMHCAGSRAA